MWPPRACAVEFSTRDARTFGFFANRDTFVAGSAGLAAEIKKPGLYAAHGQRVVAILARRLPTECDCKRDVEALDT